MLKKFHFLRFLQTVNIFLIIEIVKFTETTFINSASERFVLNTIKIRKIQENIFVTFIPYNLRLLT